MTRDARHAESQKRRRTGRTRRAIALVALLVAGTHTQATPLDDTLRALAPPPAASTPFDALPAEVTERLQRALASAQEGDAETAWSLLRDAGGSIDTPHPRVFTASAAVAEALGDTLRATLLRRRALELDPADGANRVALARLLAAGAPHDAGDVPVLASTLLDADARLSDAERDAMLAALRERMLASGDNDAANAIGRELVALPGDPDRPVPRRTAELPAETITLDGAIRAVERDPLSARHIVTRLLRTGADPEALEERCDGMEPTPAVVAIRAHLLCETGRARRGDGAIRNQLDLAPGHPALLAARARTLYLMGEYEDLRTIGAGIGDDTPERLELGATLLHAGSDHAGAYDRAVRALDAAPPNVPDTLIRRALLCARIASATGDHGAASEHLLSAHRSVPDDPRPLVALMDLHGVTGAMPDAERYAFGASRLPGIPGAAHESELLRASDALRRGYADIAEELLARLVDHRPDDARAVRALTDLWAMTGRSDEARAWLVEALDARPALSEHRVMLSRLLVARGALPSAGDVLDDWYAAHPGDETVAIELEELLRASAGSAQQADRLALRRLRREPPTAERLMERTLLAVGVGDPEDIERELGLALPALEGEDPNRDGWARELLTRFNSLAQRQRRGQFEVTPLIVRVLEEVEGLSYEAERLGVLALAARHDESRELIDAVRRATEHHPDNAAALGIDAAGVVLSNSNAVLGSLRFNANNAAEVQAARIERSAVAISIARMGVEPALASRSPALDTTEGIDTGRALGVALGIVMQAGETIGGPGSDGRAIIDAFLALDDAAREASIALAFNADADAEEAADRDIITHERLALLTHSLTRVLQGEVDAERSDAVSRAALRMSPGHPSISNDLGYRLADRGVRLEEATSLTRLAVASDPQNASFLDSLAWALYKQRRLADEGDEPGAITLLERSFEITSTSLDDSDRGSAPVIGDHLGDALWADGRTEEAAAMWATSRRLLRALLRNDTGVDLEDGNLADLRLRYPMLAYLFDLSESLDAKLAALDAGEPPTIAPFGVADD